MDDPARRLEEERLGKAPKIAEEVWHALGWALLATALLTALIVAGSRNLEHFDAALVAYTFAVLFATFGLTYRYAMWLERPPTRLYWKRGWQVFFRRGFRLRNIGRWLAHLASDFVANRFIWARDRVRGVTHLLIMWGCLLAVAITFPLVFGWLMFETVPGHPHSYRAFVFGIPTFAFNASSLFAFLVFHGLVWAAILVIAGVMLAMRRRMRDEGAAALQLFTEDFLPLILLFTVSLTGLMLTASYTWMRGYAYDFLAILHAITVIFTFLWLPFGKFFHIFQRPAQIAVRFYKEVGSQEESAICRRCGRPFTSELHLRDLIEVEKGLGFDYRMEGQGAEHYQSVCPPCRRSLFARAQGLAWRSARGGLTAAPGAAPEYVNRGLGEGPLGQEDQENYHG
ncbi:MAG TPA: MFS transporter [Thermoanaerobaculia bacterium]|nr:MFS transporter [Thermoanaerobaculia bacterium]